MNKTTAIQSEQLRQLLSVSNVSLITSVLLAVILAYMQREVIAPATLLAWCSFMVLASLLRAAIVIFYQRYPAHDDAVIRARLIKFRLGVLVAGTVWGAAGFLLFPAAHPQHQMFLMFMLAGLTAGGVVSFSSDLASAIIFSMSVTLPLMLRLFMAGDSLSVAMGMAGMLYLGFMVMALRRINRSICENIALRLEATAREDALRASKERYRALLGHLPVGVFHYDTNLIVTYCNDRFARILHSSVERLLGQDMKLLRDQSILPALRKALNGENSHYEGYYRATFSDADGWADMLCTPSRNGAGEIVGGIAIVQDVTERKRAEQELRIAATAFETQEGIMITDQDNRILRVNRAFTRLTGYSAAEVAGQTPAILQSGRQDARFYRDMWEDLKRDGYWEGEIWNRRKDSEIYPESLTITAVKNTEGQVTHYVAVFSDITLRKKADEQIHQLAFYDPLTKLPNRRLLMDRLHHAIAVGARNDSNGALLFIDLDNFKTLNDTLGHDIGDLLLQQVAQRLESCVREGDTVARLGGDEFVVILEGLSAQAFEAAAQTEAVGEKILATLSRPFRLAAHEYRGTPSIGAALFSDRQSGIEDLLKQADIAMYQAKKAGRNTLRFFDQKMQDTVTAHAALESELRQAIEMLQFHLHYQVQVDSSRRPFGAEALIRWMHPAHGLIPPAQFIPLAEETGLILPIGQWVLETACAQLKTWQSDTRTHDLMLSVNVSAKQFRQTDFVAQVHAAVQRHAINPMQLKLELTESMLLENIEDTIATISALKKIGVQFSLDDFGTGYSSLQYLKQLPLYQLKIDQSFVRDIATDSSDKAIVRTVIAMARSLHLSVIAEGVETEEQRQILLGKGCTHHQGYLYGRPVPVEQFEGLLTSLAPRGESAENTGCAT